MYEVLLFFILKVSELMGKAKEEEDEEKGEKLEEACKITRKYKFILSMHHS